MQAYVFSHNTPDLKTMLNNHYCKSSKPTKGLLVIYHPNIICKYNGLYLFFVILYYNNLYSNLDIVLYKSIYLI